MGLLDGDEQTLEVPSSEALVVSPLDDLEEQSRPIFYGLRKYLEKVTLLVVVKQNFILLQPIDIFCNFDGHVGQVLSDTIVVGVGNAEELNSPASQVFNCCNNVFSSESDMLDTCVVIVVHILLDLGLLFTICRLVDRHLDILIEVSDHD